PIVPVPVSFPPGWTVPENARVAPDETLNVPASVPGLARLSAPVWTLTVAPGRLWKADETVTVPVPVERVTVPELSNVPSDGVARPAKSESAAAVKVPPAAFVRVTPVPRRIGPSVQLTTPVPALVKSWAKVFVAV